MEYPDWLVASLRDPKTKEPLARAGYGFAAGDGRVYPLRDGILSIVYPDSLEGSDEKMNRLYRWLAPFYDLSERVLGRLLSGQDMRSGRQEIVKLLPLSKGMKLLEVSPGPGVFQSFLRDSIGGSGGLVSLDLSLPMLRQCQRIASVTRAHLIHANGACLPFADETFDGLFHFGGINLFNNPEQALSEFVRVVKRGGIVAYGDEGFSPDYKAGWRKNVLLRLNPGFSRSRPSIPTGLSEVSEHAVYGGLGYLVVAARRRDW